MTKIDIVSGFLGAGKTTLIKKMVKEAYQGEKLVLIENEFGEITKVYVKRLREKLGEAIHIETVRGMGYRVD